MTVNLILLLPELLAVGAGLGVMLWDLWLPRDKKISLSTAAANARTRSRLQPSEAT